MALISGPLIGQNLQLNLETKPSIEKSLIDSLRFQSSYSNFKSLKNGVDTLSVQFQKIGYLESRLEELKELTDSTYSAIFSLGNRWKHVDLTYESTDFDASDFQAIGVNMKNDTLRIPLTQIEAFLNRLARVKSEGGIPFASVRLEDLRKVDNERLTARLTFNARETRRVDGWVIKGYEKFPQSFLRYFAGVKRGQRFQREKLIKQNDVLDRLGFVKSVKPPEALFKKDSTIVYFYFEKTNNNLFDGILGFATNEETQKLEFNGYLDLELNNNLNFGEQLRINYKADGREQQNFSAAVKLPYLFRSPIGLSAELKIFKRDSTFSTTEQQIRAYYQTSPQTRLYIGYKNYESNDLLNEPLSGTNVEDFNAVFFLAGGEFSIAQSNPFFPMKTFIGVESEIGKRETQTKNENQLRLSASAYHNFNLNNQNSIYIGNTTGYLQSDTYLGNDLYRFGGINNLRGFNENSIDASLYTVINTEYRYQFSNALYVNSLLDFGYFENEVLNLQEELYSFGFGLGLNTQSGILKLNIANGLSTNQNFDLAQTKVHLLFTTRF